MYIPTSAPITIKSVENRKEPSSCPTTRFGGAGCCNTTRSPYIRDTNLFDECYMSSTNLTVPAFSNAVTAWIYSQRTQNSYSSAVRNYRLTGSKGVIRITPSIPIRSICLALMITKPHRLSFLMSPLPDTCARMPAWMDELWIKPSSCAISRKVP